MSHPESFSLNVEGIGTFLFSRRTMRHEIKVSAEYSRLTEGVTTPTAYLDLVSTWLATLSVLTVSAPEGWDLNAMDPLEEETYARLSKVFAALRAKEDSFRRKAAPAVPTPRPPDVHDGGVRVSPEVQPSTD